MRERERERERASERERETEGPTMGDPRLEQDGASLARQSTCYTSKHKCEYMLPEMQADRSFSTLGRLAGIFECAFFLSFFLSLYIYIHAFMLGCFFRWTFGRRSSVYWNTLILLVRWHVNMVDSWNM